MKKLRGKLWTKILAVLLVMVSVFLTLYFGLSAAVELLCYGVPEKDLTMKHYYGIYSGYQERLMEAYLMGLGEDALTYLGKQEYAELSDAVDPELTNIRYRVLDPDGNTLATNVTGGDWESAVDVDNVRRASYTVQELVDLSVVQDYLGGSQDFDTSVKVNFLGDPTRFAALCLKLAERLDAAFAEGYALEEWLQDEGTLAELRDELAALFIYEYGYTFIYGYEDTIPSRLNGTESASYTITNVSPLLADICTDLMTVLAWDTDTTPVEENGQAETDAGTEPGQWTAEEALGLGDILGEFGNTSCYILEWGVDPTLPVEDEIAQFVRRYESWEQRFNWDVAVAGICAAVLLLSLIWLLCAAGHVEEEAGIHLSTLAKCPQDVLLAVSALVVGEIVYLAAVMQDTVTLYNLIDMTEINQKLLYSVFSALGTAAALLCLPFLVGTAVQLKDHSFWRRTLIGRVLGLCWRLVRWMFGLLKKAPAVWKAVLLYIAACIGISWAYLTLFFYEWWGLYLLIALWLGGLLAVIWWANGWERVEQAGKALAEGDLAYQTNTSGLPDSMKRHAAHLNTVSQSVEQAVSERMRSDRFRTELITNVSHDLKTPLTSIINYVDLLKKLDLQDGTAREYLDVLDRKSQRLKNLTEDLVEASKASAGVLPVNKERIEVGELIRQAVGEYEDKLTAARLEVRLHTPEEPVWIDADGRHTWRILDNFFSNCTKYAMPGTRVYVDVIKRDGQVAVSVKNVSADPLNVPAEELMERFVRGDASRTTEGSGLGLSIAQSLAHLQGAELLIQVDGDLFKAIILFPEEAPPLREDEILPQ